jgi:hypothetical protein
MPHVRTSPARAATSNAQAGATRDAGNNRRTSRQYTSNVTTAAPQATTASAAWNPAPVSPTSHRSPTSNPMNSG